MGRIRRPFGRKTKFDEITFDSKLELQVYQRLRHHFKASDIKVHHPITLSGPDTFYSLKMQSLIKPLKWKIDFYLPSINTAIEVKGVWELIDRYRLMASFELLEKNLFGIHQDKDGNYQKIEKLRVIQANQSPKCWFNQNSQTYKDWFLSINQFERFSRLTTKEFLQALK